ncbi:VOC family protein [Marinicella sp. S1101]|uniref:VOC family protein n=1 Tax=Marinicella marina TaxID=2996016 RepID=UPI0022609243|nr:VOC family protein [Marinicella marina]MCX7552278.1 VOC family protein [Marinicella marina]MDJ1139154.1 VOC family protein [Marinicella marina]
MDLNQITLHSTHVNRALNFYQKLGLVLIVDAAPRYVRLACPVGTSTFSISHCDEAPSSSTTVYFEVNDVDRTCATLKHKGIQFTAAATDQKWLWREAELYDPDGHRLVIYTAGNNRQFPPWRVKQNKWFEGLATSRVNWMK